jgi:hypothetical protein
MPPSVSFVPSRSLLTSWLYLCVLLLCDMCGGLLYWRARITCIEYAFV